MRRKAAPVVLAALMCTALVGGFTQAGAVTAYEMGGGGTLTVAAGNQGMPACAPVIGQPAASCGTSTVNNWVFGSLPIFSGGVLFDTQQAGAYNCQSSIITTVGGSDNFRLNWNFDCTRTTGIGHARITGNFQNNSRPGVPIFDGCFKVGSVAAEQYNCSGTSGSTITALCGGMFEPTAFAGSPPKITQVLFEGECTSAG